MNDCFGFTQSLALEEEQQKIVDVWLQIYLLFSASIQIGIPLSCDSVPLLRLHIMLFVYFVFYDPRFINHFFVVFWRIQCLVSGFMLSHFFVCFDSAVAWCGKLNAIACASETCARIPRSVSILHVNVHFQPNI